MFDYCLVLGLKLGSYSQMIKATEFLKKYYILVSDRGQRGSRRQTRL